MPSDAAEDAASDMAGGVAIVANADSARVVAIIPARYHSTRLPGKPLLDIAGRPMILHTAERAAQARSVGRVIVATDDTRIYDTVRAAGYEACMTSEDHQTGTDRLAEVARTIEDCEIVVNVQGDEPMIACETIDSVVRALEDDAATQMATTCEVISEASDVLSADVVKVVCDERGRALYFSRSPIPLPRDLVRRYGTLQQALELEPAALRIFRKHTGLYAYRRGFLLEYADQQPTTLEQIESLEQLRALACGAIIRVVEIAESSISVDTATDLKRIRLLLESKGDL